MTVRSWRIRAVAALYGAALLVLPAQPNAATPPGNGRIVYSANNVIWALPSTGGKPVALVKGSAPAWSPDGRHLAFQRHGVYIADGHGRHVRRLVASGRLPEWSPSGRQIAYVGRDGIWVIGRDGRRKPRRLTAATPTYGGLAWTRDERILFDHDGDLVALEIPTATTSTLLSAAPPFNSGSLRCDYALGTVAVSPDGSTLAFESRSGCQNGFGALYTYGEIDIADINLRHGRTCLVGTSGTSPGAFGAEQPAWSPDGTQIAFFDVAEEGDTSLAIGNAVTCEERVLRRVAVDPNAPHGPAWQPARLEGPSSAPSSSITSAGVALARGYIPAGGRGSVGSRGRSSAGVASSSFWAVAQPS